MLDNLPVDTLIRIYSYLNVYEIHRVCSTNHALFAMDNDKRIWMEALTLVSKATLDQLWYHWSLAKTFNTDLDAQQYKEICRQVHSIHDINQIRWIPLNYHQRCQHKGFDKMEAHTMSLLEGRYVAVVGGWSRAEGNRIYVLDGWTVPHHVITLETATVNNPRFRYGFGTVVYKNKLVVYGGCREGGYAYECNGKYST